jgi:hypothetical protein
VALVPTARAAASWLRGGRGRDEDVRDPCQVGPEDWPARMRQYFDLQSQLGRAVPDRAHLLYVVGSYPSRGLDLNAIQIREAGTQVLDARTGEILYASFAPGVEEPSLELLAAQFRSERPPRDPNRAARIAAAWKRQWQTPIEEDELAVAVSAVPVQRLRDEVKFLTKYHALVSQLDAWGGNADRTGARAPLAPSAPVRLREDIAQLHAVARLLLDRLPPHDHSAVAQIMRRAWWTAQLVQAADAARTRCVARCRRPPRGLWRHIVELLWYHGWDLDPDRQADVSRLKMNWNRRVAIQSTQSYPRSLPLRGTARSAQPRCS